MQVLGLDACKGGWVAVELRDGQASGRFVRHLDTLGDEVDSVDGIGIDIPIGLPTEGRRGADVAARHVLGARRSSVFFTPVREALLAASHPEATAVSRRRTGHGVSQQAYALAPKILEAEAFVTTAPVPVWEVHPEVSFAVLLGHPARAGKRTWAGQRERHQALAQAGIVLGDLGPAGEHAALDDVFDAAIAAWSAARLVRDEGVSFPDPPERDAAGRHVAIWA